ncbi:hypothetical protein Nepgr_019387 [Nepenthes gracilis]|uniref:Uncharacterized protein n=1 Tax=Nepenthes gracilis TaxID=150966 RepID=A0AAD3SV53_NEPGR|nr:hypothetical protein Nepgr_019387 [Nepenthes gracilis]
MNITLAYFYFDEVNTTPAYFSHNSDPKSQHPFGTTSLLLGVFGEIVSSQNDSVFFRNLLPLLPVFPRLLPVLPFSDALASFGTTSSLLGIFEERLFSEKDSVFFRNLMPLLPVFPALLPLLPALPFFYAFAIKFHFLGFC